MNMRKKKLLVLMITSAMMTCPVWANDDASAAVTAAAGAATGYEPTANGETVTATAKSSQVATDDKTPVNATVTAAADTVTKETMQNWQKSQPAKHQQKCIKKQLLPSIKQRLPTPIQKHSGKSPQQLSLNGRCRARRLIFLSA